MTLYQSIENIEQSGSVEELTSNIKTIGINSTLEHLKLNDQLESKDQLELNEQSKLDEWYKNLQSNPTWASFS